MYYGFYLFALGQSNGCFYSPSINLQHKICINLVTQSPKKNSGNLVLENWYFQSNYVWLRIIITWS